MNELRRSKGKSTVFVTFSIAVIAQGYATYCTPQNELTPQDSDLSPSYSYQNFVKRYNSGEVMVLVAFSGGGTRAAAFAYGVMEGMRDQPLESQSHDVSFLNEVDNIYLRYRAEALLLLNMGFMEISCLLTLNKSYIYNNMTTSLLQRFLTQTFWFSSSGIMDEAITYYHEEIFKRCSVR